MFQAFFRFSSSSRCVLGDFLLRIGHISSRVYILRFMPTVTFFFQFYRKGFCLLHVILADSLKYLVIRELKNKVTV